ncbi:sporulation membrane protein YtaF [Bacillus pseudomycoides]|uniref:Sporulation membrane protein YtaF n=1 Tax=Bacillus pseudomycoides TaxID=64104 RepID=A0AAJ1Z3J1_9BACI|nr:MULTISPECIES: sporulation membrane protein YtaF [Bacillus cereus group]MBJ8029841.1 sporulation membrane protein YtaF [Bacillus cereus group sp. N21]MCR8859040.1 sporulation membrane protein YtaF [Bacillus pseudomycoides]MDR4328580.1 sporulation membrane protein YtaF [Bacillus pseudomycoides]MED1537970.1 sporulation membrane protein YtaF [Bacillus pseudomycoides]MED1622260.1 sporulation membrane protein YtaF [Bacillus pseudomycoides]
MSTASLFSIFLIGIASNLDNAGVGIAYGIRKIRISWFNNFIIAFFGFLFALLAGFFGSWISLFISDFIANLIGALVLGIIGVFVLCQPLLSKQGEVSEKDGSVMGILRNPENADFDRSKTISFSEALVLGVALSINNLAGGFDAGVTNLNLWWTAIISGTFSFICISGFSYIGKRFLAEYLGKWATIIAGILLILIGIDQLM